MATNMLDIVKPQDEIDEENNEIILERETIIVEEPEEYEKPEIIQTEDITAEYKKLIVDADSTEEEKEETTEMAEVKELYENIEENLTKSQKLFNKSEIKEALEKEQEKETEEEKQERQEEKEDFYTKSLDLSDEEIEMSDDFKEKKLPLGVKILIFILVLAIIVATGYFIYLKLV